MVSSSPSPTQESATGAYARGAYARVPAPPKAKLRLVGQLSMTGYLATEPDETPEAYAVGILLVDDWQTASQIMAFLATEVGRVAHPSDCLPLTRHELSSALATAVMTGRIEYLHPSIPCVPGAFRSLPLARVAAVPLDLPPVVPSPVERLLHGNLGVYQIDKRWVIGHRNPSGALLWDYELANAGPLTLWVDLTDQRRDVFRESALPMEIRVMAAAARALVPAFPGYRP